jgi:hypothetical protein
MLRLAVDCLLFNAADNLPSHIAALDCARVSENSATLWRIAPAFAKEQLQVGAVPSGGSTLQPSRAWLSLGELS